MSRASKGAYLDAKQRRGNMSASVRRATGCPVSAAATVKIIDPVNQRLGVRWLG
jgi:hypothetical protein